MKDQRIEVTNIPSLWARSIAMIIDNIILLILMLFTVESFYLPKLAPTYYYSFFIGLVWFTIPITYFTISQAKFGTTLGCRIFNIKILDHLSLEKPTFLQALSRCLMFFIFTSIPLLNIIFLIYIIFADHKRGWHDLISSTIVIKTLQMNKQVIKI